MKKLLTLVSALFAGSIGTAAADVSVSGASNFFYGSGSGTGNVAGEEDSIFVVGGSVSFAMSTETANGVTVSGSASLSADTDDIATAATGTAVGGMSQITFGMDGMTITLGDINNAGSGTGEGGDVSSFASTVAGQFDTDPAASADGGLIDGIADGTGVNVSTSIGEASVDATWVQTQGSGRNSYSAGVSTTTGNTNAYALNVGMDVAGATVNVALGGNDEMTSGTDDDSAVGVEVSYVVSDGMTLTFGGTSGNVGASDKDNQFASIAYTVDADTTLSMGFATGDDTTASVTDKQTVTSINLSRSLGGGVSVFAEYAAIDSDNAGVNTDGSAVAVGTTVTF
jgi:hypothetical protein